MSNLIFQKKIANNFLFEVYNSKPSFKYLKLHQTHSDIVIDTPLDKEIQGDGLISNFENTLCVVTADCLPIALIGESQCALIHAGWKGVQNKIVQNQLIEKIKPHTIFIGPSISKDSFEVTKEFYEQFPQSKHFIESDNKIFFNLHSEIADQIAQKYPNAQLIDCKIDTVSNKEYHSYRRDRTTHRNFNCLRYISKV